MGLDNQDHHAMSHEAAKIEIEAVHHGHTELTAEEKAELQAAEAVYETSRVSLGGVPVNKDFAVPSAGYTVEKRV